MTALQPQATDPKPGRRIGRPGTWGWVAGGAAAAGLLLARDPNASGSYGFCPLKAVTGLDCPLCGGLRGTRALLEGDVTTALDQNVLLPLFLLVGGVLAVSSARGRSITGPRVSRWLWAAVVVAAVVFGVVRNLPWFPWLQSGT
jgi:hypothetical protein